MRGLRLCDGGGNAFIGSHVTVDGQTTDLGGDSLCAFHVDVEQRDFSALCGQLAGGFRAQTRTATGHDCCEAVDFHQFHSLWLR